MANTADIQDQTASEIIRREVALLIQNFEAELKSNDLRTKVLALIPVFTSLRDLGKSLLPTDVSSARDRILYYFRKYPRTVINGNELLVVSGIQEYTRRVRELRTQFGWSIASGVTVNEMRDDEDESFPNELSDMKPDDYILLDVEPDRDAAHRWHLAHTIRMKKTSVQNKILEFLHQNVERRVTGEELRYVAGDKTEWARRVRELRTEQGWPIVTKATGRPDLPIGAYVLEADRQSPAHDRHIPDRIRLQVLKRDEFRCRDCGWSHDDWNPSEPRHLELHHIKHHAHGGQNEEGNLETLCTACHDERHKQ